MIDPEGDYTSLEALSGVTVLGGEDPPPTPRDLIRALRYPDRSVVIDLSRLPHDEKIQHIRALLSALNVLRQRTGLPHRIVLDEAHYYLHGADASQLLDLERHGYTVVTYRASRLPKEFLADAEVMIVTCESNPAEVDAFCRYCVKCTDEDRARWSILGHLKVGQAVALPITEEAGGDLRLFTMAPRLTPHVRHRQKYVDVPVAEYRAFYFGSNGRPSARRVRTLRQFVGELEGAPVSSLEPYVRRGDFSRWIADVLGDHVLATELRTLEEQHRVAARAETVPEMVAAIRGRYDFVDDDIPVPVR